MAGRRGGADARALAEAIAANQGDVESSGIAWGMRDDGDDDSDGRYSAAEAGEDEADLPEYLKKAGRLGKVKRG